MNKCSCYRKTNRYAPYALGECLGTKEVEPCLCGGNMACCDFYHHIRERANRTEYPKIIAVDFDGTLCENNWPAIGKANWDLIHYLNAEKNQGARIILWTCRAGDRLRNAIEWCALNGLTFDAVNENLPEIIERFGEDTRKLYADEYIDDKMCTKFNLPFGEEDEKEKEDV